MLVRAYCPAICAQHSWIAHQLSRHRADECFLAVVSRVLQGFMILGKIVPPVGLVRNHRAGRTCRSTVLLSAAPRGSCCGRSPLICRRSKSEEALAPGLLELFQMACRQEDNGNQRESELEHQLIFNESRPRRSVRKLPRPRTPEKNCHAQSEDAVVDLRGLCAFICPPVVPEPPMASLSTPEVLRDPSRADGKIATTRHELSRVRTLGVLGGPMHHDSIASCHQRLSRLPPRLSFTIS